MKTLDEALAELKRLTVLEALWPDATWREAATAVLATLSVPATDDVAQDVREVEETMDTTNADACAALARLRDGAARAQALEGHLAAASEQGRQWLSERDEARAALGCKTTEAIVLAAEPDAVRDLLTGEDGARPEGPLVDVVRRALTESASDAQATEALAQRAVRERLESRVSELETWQGDMLHTLAQGLDYTPTADKAVGILNGVIADGDAAEQSAADAESDLAAARQEVEHRRQECANVLANNDALRARVATLEREAAEANVRAGDAALDLIARAEAAERRVQELEKLLDDAKRFHTSEYQDRRRAERELAETRKRLERAVGVMTALVKWDADGRQHETTAIVQRARAVINGAPVPPTPAPLADAVGPNTICQHCGQRRAEHIRRHHSAGPKGTLWYCRTPTERPFTPRPASLPDAVHAALSGPLAWMLGPESDWQDGEVGVGHGFRGQAGEAHALLSSGLAAHDAAKGGETTEQRAERLIGEVVAEMDADADKARQWDAAVAMAGSPLGLAQAMRRAMGAPSPSAMNSWDEMHPEARGQWQRGMSAVLRALCLDANAPSPTSEPSISHAALAAVVEVYAKECEDTAKESDRVYTPNNGRPTQVGSDSLSAALRASAGGARELLRRVTGGQVPEVLPVARVLEVLRDIRLQVAAGPYDDGVNDAVDTAAQALGLTLDAPPSGPDGGGRRPAKTQGESCASPDGSGSCALAYPHPGDCDPAMATTTHHGGPEGEPREAPVQPASEGPPLKPGLLARQTADAQAEVRTWPQAWQERAGVRPEPDAPAVVFEGDGVRVLADGMWWFFGESIPTWLPAIPGATNPVADVLARALAEAKRDGRKLALMSEERARKAAEDMRGRCASHLEARSEDFDEEEDVDAMAKWAAELRALSLPSDKP